jgi:hypothetical protein
MSTTPIGLATSLQARRYPGGWASLQMPALCSHIDPGHLAEYAGHTLIGISPTGSPSVDVGSEKDDSEVIELVEREGLEPSTPAL